MHAPCTFVDTNLPYTQQAESVTSLLNDAAHCRKLWTLTLHRAVLEYPAEFAMKFVQSPVVQSVRTVTFPADVPRLRLHAQWAALCASACTSIPHRTHTHWRENQPRSISCPVQSALCSSQVRGQQLLVCRRAVARCRRYLFSNDRIHPRLQCSVDSSTVVLKCKAACLIFPRSTSTMMRGPFSRLFGGSERGDRP